MFGCTGGDFTHALLHPELMGQFRPGPRGWPDNPVPFEGLYLAAPAATAARASPSSPATTPGYAVLDAAAWPAPV